MSIQNLGELRDTCDSNNHPEKRSYQRARSFFVLGILCLSLPILGGCAAAGIAAAIGSSSERTSGVSLSSLSAASVAVDEAVTASDEEQSLVTAGSTITLTGGSTTSVDTGTGRVFDAPITVDYSTVSATFNGSGDATSIRIDSPVATLTFSEDQIYRISDRTFNAYQFPEDPGPGRFQWLSATNLSYMGFGLWQAVDGTTRFDGNFTWGNAYYGTYVVGEPSSSLPAAGNLSFSGGATGFLKGTYIYAPFIADISASFDLGARTGTFRMSNTRDFYSSGSSSSYAPVFSNFDFTSALSVIQGASNTAFGGSFTTTGGTAGDVVGQFYGPNGEEIGGGLLFGNSGFGVFGASR